MGVEGLAAAAAAAALALAEEPFPLPCDREHSQHELHCSICQLLELKQAEAAEKKGGAIPGQHDTMEAGISCSSNSKKEPCHLPHEDTKTIPSDQTMGAAALSQHVKHVSRLKAYL